MEIESINTTQIITVGIFLLGLIALQIFVLKNKNRPSGMLLGKMSKWPFFSFEGHSFSFKGKYESEVESASPKLPVISSCCFQIPFMSHLAS